MSKTSGKERNTGIRTSKRSTNDRGRIYDLITNPITLLVIGSLLGFLVSEYSQQKSAREFRQELIENTLQEIHTNLTHELYESFRDTSGFKSAGRPFRYLRRDALLELYKHGSVFQKSDSVVFDSFSNKVFENIALIEYFNDFVRWRNNSLVQDSISSPAKFNPGVFRGYHERVEPSLIDLESLIIKHRHDLIR